jgi:hypothetical protein
MTRNELLFIGWNYQHLNSRSVVTDPTVASRVPRRVESSADPCAALDHLRTSGDVILTDATGKHDAIESAQGGGQ